MKMLEGKVALITGAGRGLGREEAIAMAKHGCKIIVNDLGTNAHDNANDAMVADVVVEEIKKIGGTAIANYDSVADFNKTKGMIDQAVAEFGKLDIIVNNAGILRDKMIFSMEEADWDLIMAVHAKGTFNLCRHGGAYFRGLGKAGKLESKGRILNTSSDSGLYGRPSQSNYAAAKSGIATFSTVIAQELKKYCTVNCVVPSAATRLTVGASEAMKQTMALKNKSGLEVFDSKNFTPLIVYLASDQAEKINGHVFRMLGDTCWIYRGWEAVKNIHNNGQKFTPEGLNDRFHELLEDLAAPPDFLKELAPVLKR